MLVVRPLLVSLTCIAALTCAAVAATSTEATTAQGTSAQGTSGDKAATRATARETPVAHPKLDLSGRKRLGKASFYAREFNGRKMADGTRMNPRGDNAASKTLPLGTTAKVTNLETGQSAVVKIQDRGPYVPGRIVDLSPSTAEKVGIGPDKGVAAVAVTPIAVPQPDGSVKPGEASPDSTPP